jgi:hypothetical protein
LQWNSVFANQNQIGAQCKPVPFAINVHALKSTGGYCHPPEARQNESIMEFAFVRHRVPGSFSGASVVHFRLGASSSVPTYKWGFFLRSSRLARFSSRFPCACSFCRFLNDVVRDQPECLNGRGANNPLGEIVVASLE